MRTSIVFLICCIFQSTIGRNVDLPFVETASPPTVPFEALTECGQTIVADSGIIEYKLNQSYDAGELCVFVIRYTQGSGWEYLDGTFSLEADGFSDSDPFAIKILRFYDGYASEVFSLGPTERIVSFYGNGAVIVFKTRSNTGTGFRLSFSAVALSPPSDYLLGKDVVLNSEVSSQLEAPFESNSLNALLKNYFFFTSGSRIITEPDSYLRLQLTIDGNMGNDCNNWFAVYSFEDELEMKNLICDESSGDTVFEFQTRQLLIVQQRQRLGRLTNATGIFKWETVSQQNNVGAHQNQIFI